MREALSSQRQHHWTKENREKSSLCSITRIVKGTIYRDKIGNLGRTLPILYCFRELGFSVAFVLTLVQALLRDIFDVTVRRKHRLLSISPRRLLGFLFAHSSCHRYCSATTSASRSYSLDRTWQGRQNYRLNFKDTGLVLKVTWHTFSLPKRRLYRLWPIFALVLVHEAIRRGHDYSQVEVFLVLRVSLIVGRACRPQNEIKVAFILASSHVWRFTRLEMNL